MELLCKILKVKFTLNKSMVTLGWSVIKGQRVQNIFCSQQSLNMCYVRSHLNSNRGPPHPQPIHLHVLYQDQSTTLVQHGVGNVDYTKWTTAVRPLEGTALICDFVALVWCNNWTPRPASRMTKHYLLSYSVLLSVYVMCVFYTLLWVHILFSDYQFIIRQLLTELADFSICLLGAT